MSRANCLARLKSEIQGVEACCSIPAPAHQRAEEIMALTTCYDCGCSLSESAGQCPHCRSLFVRGVKCVVCRGLMKSSESVLRHTTYSFRFLHKRCGASLFGGRGNCWECGTTIWGGGWFSDWVPSLSSSLHDVESLRIYKSDLVGPAGVSSRCRTCGVRDPLKYVGLCGLCTLPIYRQLHQVSEDGAHHRLCEAQRAAR